MTDLGDDRTAILKRIAELQIQIPGGQVGIAFEYFLGQFFHH